MEASARYSATLCYSAASFTTTPSRNETQIMGASEAAGPSTHQTQLQEHTLLCTWGAPVCVVVGYSQVLRHIFCAEGKGVSDARRIVIVHLIDLLGPLLPLSPAQDNTEFSRDRLPRAASLHNCAGLCRSAASFLPPPGCIAFCHLSLTECTPEDGMQPGAP